MKKFIAAASIGQFREMVSNVNRTANFVGLDDNGNAIYDPTLKKPVINFIGTVKCHGTFSAVCYNEVSGIWYQSKESIITPTPEVLYKVSFDDETNLISTTENVESHKNIVSIKKIETHDNAGFAFFAESKKEVFIELIKTLAVFYEIDLTKNTIMLCAEWAGKGVQGTVALSKIDKSAFIFSHAKVAPFDDALKSYWIYTQKISSIENRIYNIEDFKTFSIDVDFNVPQLSQNNIIDLTIEVENECPVAKEFGHIGVGEGIVFSCLAGGERHVFKSKGEKHAGKSKVKTLKPVDNEKINKMIDVANRVTPAWRLDQMLTEACDLLNGGKIERIKIADYIRLVIKDILKEESFIISDAGLEPNDINKYVSQIAKEYFFEREKDFLGV